MTEILVTTQTTPDAPPPNGVATPEVPATPVATPDPAAPPAKTPEQLAADATLQAERKEVREIAEAQGRAWRAQQELKARDARISELEAARKSDLDRLANIEAREASLKDPKAVLERLEEAGLTPADLIKANFERGTPEAVIAAATKKAEASAEAKLKKILEERDGEAKKLKDERDRIEAFDSWQKGIITAETDYPATTAMLSAGPMMRELVRQQAFRIYALAADEAQQGKTYTDTEINKSLETFLAKEYGSLTERRGVQAQKPGTASGSTETAKGSAAAPNVTDARANDLATLGGDLPKDFGTWDPMKQNKWFLDQVTKR